MTDVNPKIPGHFKDHSDKNPNFPKDMLKLLDKLLATVNRKGLDAGGLEKMVDQVTEGFADNNELVEWCKKYGE